MSAEEWITQRRELLNAATEGPWEATFGPRELARVWTTHPDDREALAALTGFVEDCDGGADAALIADTRTSLPRALDALEAVLTVVAPAGAEKFGPDFEAGLAKGLQLARAAIESALRADA